MSGKMENIIKCIKFRYYFQKNPLGEDYQEESVGEVKPPKKK